MNRLKNIYSAHNHRHFPEIAEVLQKMKESDNG